MKNENFRVIIESPYKGFDLIDNLDYARRCMWHSLLQGESPFVSHLLYTQVLDDTVPEQREMGMTLARNWYEVADLCAVYTDRGISWGMEQGIEYANSIGLQVEERSLSEEDAKVDGENSSERSYKAGWR